MYYVLVHWMQLLIFVCIFSLSSTYEFEPREPSHATRAQINRAA